MPRTFAGMGKTCYNDHSAGDHPADRSDTLAMQNEEKQKPSLWNQALKVVKGGLMREAEGQRQKTQQDYQDVLQQLDANQKETKQRLDELSRRIAALEKPDKSKKGPFRLGADAISRLTVLAAIVCGAWVIVTVLKLFM